jgi:hypothetical protein
MGNGMTFNGSVGPLQTYDLTTNAMAAVGGNIDGNAFGEGRDGFLYAGAGYSLYRVNPASGASTHVGDGNWGYAGDLAVDPLTDVLYGAVNGQWGVTLVTVNRTNGAQTTVGLLGVTGDIWGLGFSGNGTLFAGGPDGNGRGAIYQINKSTGAAGMVRSLSYEPFDMATQPYTVPEDQHVATSLNPPSSPGGPGGAGAGPGGRIYYEEDLEGVATALGGTARQVWEKGTPTAGPRSAASGTQCLATRTVGGYPAHCFDTVETPPLSLVGAERPVLVFRHWYDTEEGQAGGAVRVRTALGESTLEPGVSGSSRGWVVASYDLSAFAGQGDVRIGFTFRSSSASDLGGWFVDDILVAEAALVEARLGRTRPDAAGAAGAGR